MEDRRQTNICCKTIVKRQECHILQTQYRRLLLYNKKQNLKKGYGGIESLPNVIEMWYMGSNKQRECSSNVCAFSFNQHVILECVLSCPNPHRFLSCIVPLMLGNLEFSKTQVK